MPHYKDTNDNIHYLQSEEFIDLLPDGCHPITDTEAASLQQPTRELSFVTLLSEIKAERDRRRFSGGIKVADKWFQTTTVATGEYNTLLLMSDGLDPATVLRAAWRTMDGTTVDMTPALAKQILSAGFTQVAAIDDAAQAHKAAMLASPDPSAYDYSTGWPTIFTDEYPS